MSIGVLVRSLCVAVAASFMTLPLFASPAEAVSGGTYKVLTYNVNGMPEPYLDQEGKYGMDESVRAAKISNWILAGNYDIVALNEVMDEDMREEFTEKLGADYPFVIAKLDGPVVGDMPASEDSGLMLFSKFPAVDIAMPADYTPSPWQCHGPNVPPPGLPSACKTIFHTFTNASGWDAEAAKGVALARFANPLTGRDLNVFFTHMNADFGDDNGSPARYLQAQEIVEFMQSWAPKGNAADTILMGDLNIPAVIDGTLIPSQEYLDLVAAYWPQQVSLQDTRSFTSPQDYMWTKSAENSLNKVVKQRLDYILWRPAAGGALHNNVACIQHLTREKHFRFSGQIDGAYHGTDLSDHYGVAAVFGVPGSHCSANLAKDPVPEGAQSGHLNNGGAYQWYRYDEPGTYSIRATTAQVPMEVTAYAISDLSVPLSPSEGDTTIDPQSGCSVACDDKVVFSPSVPFLVRVRALSPTYVGGYTYYSHKHIGASFDDAIQIDPFEVLDQVQMSPQVTNPLTKVHYRLKQHRLFSGAKQQLTFKHTNHPGMKLRLQVYNGQRQPLAGLSTNYPSNNLGLFNQTLTVDPATSPISGDEQTLYFTVERQTCAGGCRDTYQVTWETNYRQADLKELRVVVQDDDWTDDGLDEVGIEVAIDTGPSKWYFLGEFDEMQSKLLPTGLQKIGYAGSVAIAPWEMDVGANESFGTKSITPSTTGTIITWTHFDGGVYEIHFQQTKNIDD